MYMSLSVSVYWPLFVPSAFMYVFVFVWGVCDVKSEY